ncbi:DUF305 domain-containing protein [Parablastomonas sp. CN1-191]|uniref:DUF305 domain-containing protein n=1 Tax=Parablastomonas sp. CN1-191 TaxID=3400908 RepID=UPI003BF80E1D
MESHEKHEGMIPAQMGGHYKMFALNLAISLLVMYLAMFAMIWSMGEFVQNLNFFYMALVMWAPMAIVMVLTMKSMLMNARLNMILCAGFALVLVLSFAGIRDQSFVNDRAFLKSMLPHHSGALTMCNRASISDPEIKELCFGPNGIVRSQEREIEQMKRILKRL